MTTDAALAGSGVESAANSVQIQPQPSTMPSAKYSCSGSPLRLAKGSTAIDGLLPTDEDWGTEPRTDAAKVRLRDVLRPRKTSIDYLYDFGDCWEHRLTLTNIRSGDPVLFYPRYILVERLQIPTKSPTDSE